MAQKTTAETRTVYEVTPSYGGYELRLETRHGAVGVAAVLEREGAAESYDVSPATVDADVEVGELKTPDERAEGGA